jgi:hypothetical protein
MADRDAGPQLDARDRATGQHPANGADADKPNDNV